MQKLSKIEYSTEALQRLVRSVTFFKDIVQVNPSQFDLLLSVSEFVQAQAGETVLQKGNQDQVLYFLLKGQMSVFSEDDGDSLNIINPGEVFGALSMVTGRGRSATVKAETDVVLLGIDFKYFREVEDFSLFSMETKLIAYRMMLHNIRWNLELNKMQDPENPLNKKLLKLPIYKGEKGDKEELMALHEQSRLLAELLCEWNDAKKVHRKNILSEI
ncbi:cyclic nucleotide-binding domain-containing protein [Bermanella sp. WJH001]|uniref:cyclic nucleotide-binding domain-containing protein n=1 Tax=Bermanella sp. WJH001 TaxID=3048005 RepID=UPI0024BEC595|nr:cyclic nucleotide-binding domain-containing protein [Bermanella sp. WJH001]MDJ1538123.1 cyclic nucleotide-binding domain-containing protein [Bermanella sp. WJH001]